MSKEASQSVRVYIRKDLLEALGAIIAELHAQGKPSSLSTLVNSTIATALHHKQELIQDAKVVTCFIERHSQK